MRLLLSCTELGLGHVSRVIPLGKKLEKKGNDLFFFSGGTAYELLKKEFDNVFPCTPVGWYENAQGVSTSASVLNILFPLLLHDQEKNKLTIKSPSAAETIHRYYDLRKHIRRIKPDLIVSDGDMHALRLGHRWRIPSVYITNIIRPSYGFPRLLVPGERFTERYVKKCERIIVPDNPAPYTVCGYNLGDLNKMRILDRVAFVGSFLDMAHNGGGEKHIFVSISGPWGTRAKLARMIIPMLSRFERKSVVSLGEPQSRFAKKLGNCEIYGWLGSEKRSRFMREAQMVVFSGGHGTCFEVVKYGKSSVCVPTQPEQMGNAKKLQELGCSVMVKAAKQFLSAVMLVEEELEFYRGNVGELSEFSSKFVGLDGAVEVIEDVLEN